MFSSLVVFTLCRFPLTTQTAVYSRTILEFAIRNFVRNFIRGQRHNL